MKEVLAKAKEGGFHALALTVDFTWYGNRERGTYVMCIFCVNESELE